jgi:hypothetical protein
MVIITSMSFPLKVLLKLANVSLKHLRYRTF